MSMINSSNPTDVPKLDPVSSTSLARFAPGPSDAVNNARRFDSRSDRDWLELVRDIAAIAHRGGGELLLRTAALSEREIVERFTQFTDSSFTEIQVRNTDYDHVALKIGRAGFPILFTSSGNYTDAANPLRRIEVIAPGTVYFWNGNTSECATSRSLQSFIESLMRRIRRRWLAGIRRVVKQPIESLVDSRRADRAKPTTSAEANLQPVRIVTDPNAPALQPQDVDRLYPLRQKDLVTELNLRLGRRALNSYDIQAVRRQHRLDERPDFVFHLPGAGRRYSPAVMEWIMAQNERDSEFFRKARMADNEMLKLRRQKPR